MKVISYNIHRGMDSYNKPTIMEIARYLKNQECDIICLQEVLYPQYKSMKHHLKMDGIFAENVKSQRYGICIFTRYKIAERNHVFLTSDKEQRGLAHLKLQVGKDDYINIINTHLGLSQKERDKQINEILDFAKCRENTIICGDFNEKYLCLPGFYDVAQDFHKEYMSTFKMSRIDYCFASPNLKTVSYRVDEVFMSDHFPIKIRFW